MGSSVVEHMLSMCTILGFLPSTTHTQELAGLLSEEVVKL